MIDARYASLLAFAQSRGSDCGRDPDGKFGGGNKCAVVGGVLRPQSTEPHEQEPTFGDKDDDHVYHVTTQGNAASIMSDGFKQSGSTVKGGAYETYSKGKLFFTEKSGLATWKGKIEDHLFHEHDDPPPVAIVRVKKSEVEHLLKPDEIGTKDAGSPAYYVDLTGKKKEGRAFCATGQGNGIDNSCGSKTMLAPDSDAGGGEAAASPYKYFASESEALKSAVTRWKGDPTDLGIHVQDEIDGSPTPPSGSGTKLREMASALLKEVKENSRPAPTLYRGDNKTTDDNSSALVGWSSNRRVAEKWADRYGGSLQTLEGASGVKLSDIVGKTMDTGEDEWIVLNSRPPAGGVHMASPIESPAFKEWFGGSKVVDASGNPVVVYHGTSSQFDEFDPAASPVNDDGYMGAGSYFVEDKKSAAQYSLMASDNRPGTPRVVAAYLSIKNPVVISKSDQTYGMTREEVVAWTEKKKSQGHDGATNGQGEWVAFYPNQIKKAPENKKQSRNASLLAFAQGRAFCPRGEGNGIDNSCGAKTMSAPDKDSAGGSSPTKPDTWGDNTWAGDETPASLSHLGSIEVNRPRTEEDVAQLAGSMGITSPSDLLTIGACNIKDAEVEIDGLGMKILTMRADIPAGKGKIKIDTAIALEDSGPTINYGYLALDTAALTEAVNDPKVSSRYGGQIYGAMLASMETAEKAGFVSATTTAEGYGPGNTNGRRTDLQGYRLWGRFGFDGDIPKGWFARVASKDVDVESVLSPEANRSLKASGTVRLQQLLSTKQGENIWKQWGVPIELEFDFTDKTSDGYKRYQDMLALSKRTKNRRSFFEYVYGLELRDDPSLWSGFVEQRVFCPNGEGNGITNDCGPGQTAKSFPEGSQNLRDAVDSVAPAPEQVWDRSKGLAETPPAKQMDDIANEQTSNTGVPLTPEAEASYGSLVDEIGRQYEALTAAGLKARAWRGDGEPYGDPPGSTKPNSNKMREEVAKTGEFSFYMTDKGFGTGDATPDHPMLRETKFKTADGEPMIANDLFRVVHDMVAHVRGGYSFSTNGEYNGMLTHASTLPEAAWPALFAETFGQNAVYEKTKNYAPQNAYASKVGPEIIRSELKKRTKSSRAAKKDGDEPLGYQHIKSRPELLKSLVEKRAFCATGDGNGIDNSCGAKVMSAPDKGGSSGGTAKTATVNKGVKPSSPLSPKNRRSWMNPSGDFYPVASEESHNAWAAENTSGGKLPEAEYDDAPAGEYLFKSGWLRITDTQDSFYIDTTSKREPSGVQKKNAIDFAIHSGNYDEVLLTDDGWIKKTLWRKSDDRAFCPNGTGGGISNTCGKGVGINDKDQDFTGQILSGEKTIETRPSNSLKSFIGKTVGIVRTGKGKATLVGVMKIGEPKFYKTPEEFDADFDKHRVGKDSKHYIGPDGKFGYPLSEVKPAVPMQIDTKHYVARVIPKAVQLRDFTIWFDLSGVEIRGDAPAPKKDRVKGSDVNSKGSAKNKSGDISLDEGTISSLKKKVEEHNAAMREAGKPDWTHVRLPALKAVFRRGAGAFSTSHRPGMARDQWAMARVNAFLTLARRGRPENAKYTTDNDLLSSKHPKHSKESRSSDCGRDDDGRFSSNNKCGGQVDMPKEDPRGRMRYESGVQTDAARKLYQMGTSEKKLKGLVETLGGDVSTTRADINPPSVDISVADKDGNKLFHIEVQNGRARLYPTKDLSDDEIGVIKNAASEAFAGRDADTKIKVFAKASDMKSWEKENAAKIKAWDDKYRFSVLLPPHERPKKWERSLDARYASLLAFAEARDCGQDNDGKFSKGNTCASGIAADAAKGAAKGAALGALAGFAKTFLPQVAASHAAVGAVAGAVKGIYDNQMKPTRVSDRITRLGMTDEGVANIVKSLGGSKNSVASTTGRARLTVKIKNRDGKVTHVVDFTNKTLTIYPKKAGKELSDSELQAVKEIAKDNAPKQTKFTVKTDSLSYVKRIARNGFEVSANKAGIVIATSAVSAFGSAVPDVVGGLADFYFDTHFTDSFYRRPNAKR